MTASRRRNSCRLLNTTEKKHHIEKNGKWKHNKERFDIDLLILYIILQYSIPIHYLISRHQFDIDTKNIDNNLKVVDIDIGPLCMEVIIIKFDSHLNANDGSAQTSIPHFMSFLWRIRLAKT